MCFNCLQTYIPTVVFGFFKSRSGVASLLLSPSVVSSLPEPSGHPYERGMGDGHGSRELHASGTSERAPYGWTLRPVRDGHWAKRAAYVAVWEQGRKRVVTWAQRAGAQACGDVGAAGRHSPVVLVQPT